LPRLYWVLWVGQFINRLGAFVLTFLPLFLTERLGYTDAEAGVVLAGFGLGNVMGAAIGGYASDRFGRRQTLLVGLFVSAAAVSAVGVAPNPPLLLLAVVLQGASNGYGPALTAAVSDVVPQAERRRAFGYLYWAINLGFAAAALAGGALSRRGYGWLFVGDALTSLVFLGIVYAVVPETRPDTPEGRDPVALGSLPRVFGDLRFAGFAVAHTLVLCVFVQSFMTLPLQERAAGLPVTSVGAIAALNGIVILVTQPVFLRFTRLHNDSTLLAVAAALVGLAALVAAHARTTPTFLACMTIVSLGEVAFSSAAPAFVARVAPIDRRGTYQAAYSLCWGVASLVAPLVGPASRVRFGSVTMWSVGAGICGVAAVAHLVATRSAERRLPHAVDAS
jgi:MFS family permease